jgi:predicted RNase H-like HicB family nuclease
MLNKYYRGFEDAVELCLHKVEQSKTIEDAKKSLQEILSLLKEQKLAQLEKNLKELNIT